MGKADDKGEPVKTVTIGGKKVEVPIIFVLPEEAGEKEIERYEHPKVHVESKKEGASLPDSILDAGEGIADKIGGLDLPKPEAETVGSNAVVAQADSKEEPLEELTDGKLEEVEKLPFPVPREETRDEKIEATRMNEDRAVAEGKVRPPQNIHLINTKDPFMSKAEDDEENTPYFDLLSDKPKKKKKPKDVSYRALFDKGYGKAQALRRSVEEQKKRGEKTDDELEAEKKVPKGQQGMLNYNYLFDKPDEKEYLTDEEGDEIEKSWERWLKQKDGDWSKLARMMGDDAFTNFINEINPPAKKEKPSGGFIQDLDDPEDIANKALWKSWLQNKSLGALGWGKLNRDGTKKKLRRRQPTLDDYPEDDNGDKKDET